MSDQTRCANPRRGNRRVSEAASPSGWKPRFSPVVTGPASAACAARGFSSATPALRRITRFHRRRPERLQGREGPSRRQPPPMVARASRWTACGSGPCRGHAPWLLDPEEVVVAAEGAATGALFARVTATSQACWASALRWAINGSSASSFDSNRLTSSAGVPRHCNRASICDVRSLTSGLRETSSSSRSSCSR